MIKKILAYFAPQVRSFESITADLHNTAEQLLAHAEEHATHMLNKAAEIARLSEEQAAHGIEKARSEAVAFNVKRLLNHG